MILCMRLVLAVLVLAALGCEKPTTPEHTVQAPPTVQWLVDVSRDAGVIFEHDSGVIGKFFMPEIVGSGAAIFDYDNDGDLDIYLINSGPHDTDPSEANANTMFAQEQGFRFVDRSAESGLADTGYGMGVAVGDIDNDGDLDVYVTNYGSDRLYRNEGDGRFSDVTGGSGIDSPNWSSSATFFDYDVDGFLDLYVVTYVTNKPPKACTTALGRKEYCGPNAFRGTADVLYHNDGDGTFTDVSGASGIGAVLMHT